jgi:hypothetical protein
LDDRAGHAGLALLRRRDGALDIHAHDLQQLLLAELVGIPGPGVDGLEAATAWDGSTGDHRGSNRGDARLNRAYCTCSALERDCE